MGLFQGKAKIIGKNHPEFSEMKNILGKMTQGKFPFATVTEITVNEVKSIIAPRYMLYPETTEAEQIESAKKTYRI